MARRSKHVSVPASTCCCVFFIPHKSHSTFKHLHLFSRHTTGRFVVFCTCTRTQPGLKEGKSLSPLPGTPLHLRFPAAGPLSSLSKGWSIFHCLKLPRPQAAGGNKTIFDLAKGKMSEVKGQSEEFTTAAKAAEIQAPDQKLPSCSTCHVVQLLFVTEGQDAAESTARHHQFSPRSSVLPAS